MEANWSRPLLSRGAVRAEADQDLSPHTSVLRGGLGQSTFVAAGALWGVVSVSVAGAGMGQAERQFEDFVLARRGDLVRFAYALTGDVMHAEDVVQVVLERTWRRWSQVVGDRPEAYVRTAIARTAISRYRTLLRRVREAPLETVVPLLAVGDDGARSAEARDMREVLWAELALLPPRMRVVVVLRVWEDLSEADTARLLGCSVGTVKSQLSRGMARLRERSRIRQLAGQEPVAGGAGR